MRVRYTFALAAVFVAATIVPVASRLGSSQEGGHAWMGLEATVAELRWSGDLLTALHRTSGRTPRPGEDWVTVHDVAGSRILRVVPSDALPEARMVNVQEAVASDGLLLVSAYVGNDQEQHANLLLRYDLTSGALQRIARIDPLVCWYLAVDSRSIWCLGGNSATFDQGSKDFDLLYRFSHNGVLQESALRWLHEFPEVSLPMTISNTTGAPSLTATDGGVRAWLPKAGRLVTWRPGQALRVTPLPSDIVSVLDRRGNQAVDVGTGMVVTLPQVAPNSLDHRIAVWRDSSATVTPTGATLASDSRVIGARRDRLLVWDRRAQQLRWEPAPWLP